jgi:tetratricopeptide (TPR) repeat protein
MSWAVSALRVSGPLQRSGVEALALRRELWGERHPDVADSLFNLGAVRYNQGHYPEALDLLLEAEAIYLQTLGADHPTTQALQSWLAGTRAALGGQAE